MATQSQPIAVSAKLHDWRWAQKNGLTTILRMNQLSKDEDCLEDKVLLYSGQETTDKSTSYP